ncbi:MAG: hypothetical protein LBS55_09575 [Prevotellaceae bacterium]|nr:hypothetical protein [Prevotellaceae bacterium]
MEQCSVSIATNSFIAAIKLCIFLPFGEICAINVPDMLLVLPLCVEPQALTPCLQPNFPFFTVP